MPIGETSIIDDENDDDTEIHLANSYKVMQVKCK